MNLHACHRGFQPSRWHRKTRVKLLEKVTRQGYVDGYSGMRIAKSGSRFMITDATVWNLVDEHGNYAGQAAVFTAP